MCASTEEKETAADEHKKKTSDTSSSEGDVAGQFTLRAGLFGRRRVVTGGRDFGVWEKSLEDQANCLSHWTLNYLNPLLALGAQKVLDADDIGVPSKQDEAERAYQVALAAWEVQSEKAHAANAELKAAYEATLAACETEEERKKIKEPEYKEPSIATALVKGFGIWPIVLALIYQVVGSLLTFGPVLILNTLVTFFESGQPLDEYDGRFGHPWIQVALLGILPPIVSLLQTRHSVIMAHAAVFVRTAVSTMLYRKTLRVSAAGRAITSTGQVVNMMSNDTAQLQRFLQFIGFTLTAPLTIGVALYLIFQQVGNATWVGVAFMVFLAPVNTIVFSMVAKQRRLVLKFSDLRVKMMNEILNGIRIIKFYAWEKPFGKEVGELRGKELEALTKLAYTTAIGFSLILLSAPLIQPILVFLTYVNIQNKSMDAATAFTTVALFNMIRFPFAFLPMGLLQFIQSRISLKRLERYLDLPELPNYVEKKSPPSQPNAEPGSIIVKEGTFSWVDPDAKPIRPIQEVKPERRSRRSSRRSSRSSQDLEQEMQSTVRSNTSRLSQGSAKTPSITLQDLTFTIPSGHLVAVVGSVGSGKSSFLSAILGEMEPLKGSKVYMPHPENAAPGFVSYCTQTPWVVNDTLRGNILFGRPFDQERYDQVVEACALLDDINVLPAGDMTEIGERGINLSGGQKARVSLARALYSGDTKVMLMDDPLSAVDAHVGEHIFSKAITGPLSKGLTRVLVTHHVHLLSRCDSVIVLEKGRIKHHGKYRDLIKSGVDFAGAVDVSKAKHDKESQETKEETPQVQKKEELSAEQKTDLAKSGKKLVKEEERNMGSVEGSAYWHYAKAGGYCVALSAIIIQALGRGAELAAGFWLAFWAEQSVEAELEDDPFSAAQTNRYLAGYSGFQLLGVLGLTFRAIVIAVHRLGASKLLHDDLTDRILRAPVSFFDVTPTGRILNRFAADMDKIDLELTQSLSQGMSTVFNVIGALVAISVATQGTFLGPLVPLGYMYHMIQKWFRKTSTELQRVNSIANSPIFADFSQTLSGTSTIRAYSKEIRFFEQMKDSFDKMNGSYLLVQLTNYWLGLRLDLLGGLVGAFIGALAVGTYSSGFIQAGYLGLSLSYSIEMTNYLKHGVRMIATIEAQMNSVERVLYYSTNIETEASDVNPDADPDTNEWPSRGEIDIKNASMRYRDGPIVLKGINVHINGGEKVGVCGRTGSGKSSLMVALFRISELEQDGGGIYIDGVNTGALGTSTLRLNLSIIPQDPIIFSNTVRYNLDPFKSCTDEELWEVLEKVQMHEVIAELPGQLLYECAEGGENFSQGQRQLLCIARALLRKPRILIMDEATASIDNTTDATIQTMIRENFKDATVLTIAHRLNTIMDSDRVLVLDDGYVAEFDSPQALLQKPDGIFKAMVEKSREAKAHGDD